MSKKGYSAYVLTESSRLALLKEYPGLFPKVIAHHITYQFPDQHAPPVCRQIEVIGYACTPVLAFNEEDHSPDLHEKRDLKQVECVVVRVLGTHLRPDQKIFHITLSLDPKTTRPVDSNFLLTQGWKPLVPSFWLEVEPQFIEFSN